MKLRDILKDKGSEIYSVSKDTSIADAVKMMVNKGVGSVIITEGKCPMGIFTERDLLKTVCQRGLDTSKGIVESIMTKDVVCGRADDDVQYAINTMTELRIRHLPICDETGLIGIISIGDIVKLQYRELEFENRMLKDYLSDKYPG